MHKSNVNLIGELVPYIHCWHDYSCNAFYKVLDVVTLANIQKQSLLPCIRANTVITEEEKPLIFKGNAKKCLIYYKKAM